MTTSHLAHSSTGGNVARRRSAAVVLCAVLAAGVLAGCSLDRLGAAAVVGGKPISTDRVHELTTEYLRALPDQDPGPVQRGILDQLITARVYAEVARDQGVGVRNAQVAAELSGLIERFQGRRALVQAIQANQEVPEFVAPSMLESWLKTQLLFVAVARRLNGGVLNPQDESTRAAFTRADREVAKVANRLDVEVNPRYGRWRADRDVDPTVSSIVPLVSGGLSKSEDELTGAR